MEDKITICGETYLKEKKAVELTHVIIRSRDAGVFAGYLVKKEGNEVQLKDARRLWFWSGAASLSQLAMEGTSKPARCKFPIAVDEITVLGVIEIIPTTEKARKSIDAVKVWES
jgi:hypothetical protein